MEVRLFGKYIEDFLHSQPNDIKETVFWAIRRLSMYGHDLRMPDSKHLGKGLFELRATGTSPVRLFYVFKNDTAFILHGFVKKSDKIPARELKTARRRHNALAQV